MNTLLILASVLLIAVIADIRKSHKQQPAINELIGELQAKEIGIILAYRRQIAEEAKIEEIAKHQIAEENAVISTIPGFPRR
tara:strand:+ start:218 stop:463 length:246 start_codon:yes stop_codon:yes gene_type:complete